MELLLRKDHEKLGKQGDIVNVADGYARNYLLPRGIAAKATAENKKIHEMQRRSEVKREEAKQQALVDVAKTLQSTSCTIPAPAGPDGRLFGSVGADDIAQAFKAEGLPVEPKMVQLEHPLRETGVFLVTLRVTPEVKAVTRVWVVEA